MDALVDGQPSTASIRDSRRCCHEGLYVIAPPSLLTRCVFAVVLGMEAADPLEAGWPCEKDVVDSVELIERLSSSLSGEEALLAAWTAFRALSLACSSTDSR